MKKTFKKIAASVMTAATLAVGTVGMTASAYSPTITKSFGSGATATLYADGSYAYATTSRSGKDCTVTVTYHGTSKSGSGYGSAQLTMMQAVQVQARIRTILPVHLIQAYHIKLI